MSAPASTAPDPVDAADAAGSTDASAVERPSPLRRVLEWRPHTLGLRQRILAIFTLGALGLAAVLAITTYGLVRSNVVSQRDDISLDASYRNAQVVQERLQAQPATAQVALDALDSLGVQRPLIYFRGSWSTDNNRFNDDALPDSLRRRVLDDGVPASMVTAVDGDTVLAVGIPLVEVGAYFEFFSLEEDDRALSNVGLSLMFAAVITTFLGVVAGIFAARRAVRPLGAAAQAATSIASGRLDTRLKPTDDPDLGVLANAFNEMAAGLQRRVEQDARFASDVSHELRSPLMTLSASIGVIDARRHEMPERAQVALDLLKSDVARFQGLVEDLLEISRFEAGAVRLHQEPLLAAEFVMNAVAVSSLPDTPVTVAPRAQDVIIEGDRRRLARVLANLIDNATAYGGGSPTVAISEVDGPNGDVSHIQIAVEDRGPGIPEGERQRIFERFSRGTAAAGRRVGTEGAGLGLSLVAEHVRLHGGRVWVEDRMDGESGARFVIELLAMVDDP
ncbi:MAG: HAMP domain-containing histidine kinase [Actinomycetota bacterium]|nr:HAMP domain-containing histidine kinase [Actinomycetota bacterium]